MLGPSDMKGKTALVTGASGDLGKAVALKLAEAGADICLADPDAAALDGAAGQVRALGVRAAVHASDLTGAASCRAAVDAAVQAFGRLDALCNVANVFKPDSTPRAAFTPSDVQTRELPAASNRYRVVAAGCKRQDHNRRRMGTAPRRLAKTPAWHRVDPCGQCVA